VTNVRKLLQICPKVLEMMQLSLKALNIQVCVFDEIGRIMPGTKDYVSVNSKGKKIHLQK
jgi:hypothetical protein